MTNQKAKPFVFFILLLFCGQLPALAAPEINTGTDNQKNLAITIYNNNLALIKDARQLNFQKGRLTIGFQEVSAKIRPETAIFSGQGSDTFRLMEQNFDFDLLTPEKLLEKYIGKEIQIVRINPVNSEEKTLNATVLSTNRGVVFQIGNHIETGMPSRLIFPEVPKTLRSKPTLLIELVSNVSGTQDVELSYLTSGMSWKADYIAKINRKEDAMDLNGWVTLTNQTGIKYKKAQLQLVAGDVNQVRDQQIRLPRMKTESLSMTLDSGVKEEALFDYHLYSLPEKTDILNNQTKQVALFNSENIPIKKSYIVKGKSHYYQNRVKRKFKKTNAAVYITFDNKNSNNLGIPLPKGIIRTYKNDQLDNLQFVGEDRINHTAKNETVRLMLGQAFDITSTKRQLNFKIISRGANKPYITESEFEISVKNAKNHSEIVSIIEPVPGDWKILKESQPHIKNDAFNAEWKIKIPAKNSITLNYTVRITH